MTGTPAHGTGRPTRGYVQAGWGQVHYRQFGAGNLPPLVCLHATAYSGAAFEPLMPWLAGDRRVIALDTPGYGESDGPPEPVAFETYAATLADAVEGLSRNGPVDVLGYHTGALLAAEIARSRPGLARRLVLIGVPFFADAEKSAWRARLVRPAGLSEDFEQFRERWDYFIAGRTPGLSLDRAFACFVDELKCYPREWWAHEALFGYDAQARLRTVAAETLVLNPAGPLADASRRAAAIMPRARVEELPQLSGAIFDLGPEIVARHIDGFLADSNRMAA